MNSFLNPRNLLQKARSAPTPTIPLRATVDAKCHRKHHSWAEVAVAILGGGIGLAMIGIAIWGFWVSADVPRYADFTILGPQQHKLNAAISLLTWLVIFGPFMFFGIAILWSIFVRENRAWLAPLRMFTYIVSLRAKAEVQRRNLRDKSGKMLPTCSSLGSQEERNDGNFIGRIRDRLDV